MTRRYCLALIAGIVIVLSFFTWLNREWIIGKVYLYTLESTDRVENLQVDRVIQALRLQTGQKVADVGAGTGVFSFPLAEALGDSGRVYAVDVNPELLSHIEETARAEGVENIQTVLAAENDPLIPEAVDLIFLCDTLHHIDNQAEYVKTLRKYLRAGRRVAVIDFGEDSPHLLPSMKYSLLELKQWMQADEYELMEEHDFLQDNFFVIHRYGD